MTRKPAFKRKPRGVVERFLAGESVAGIAFDRLSSVEWIEAILRRALAKKGGKRG